VYRLQAGLWALSVAAQAWLVDLLAQL